MTIMTSISTLITYSSIYRFNDNDNVYSICDNMYRFGISNINKFRSDNHVIFFHTNVGSILSRFINDIICVFNSNNNCASDRSFINNDNEENNK
jgi:hypothetical protein